MSETENLTEQLNVPVTPTMKRDIEELAWRLRVSAAEVARTALDNHLKGAPVFPPAGAPVEHKFGGDR
jgi:hypothetical protein